LRLAEGLAIAPATPEELVLAGFSPSCPCGQETVLVQLGGLDGAYQAIVHEPDAGLALPYHWGAWKVPRDGRLYARRQWRDSGRNHSQFMHSLLTGRPLVDHENGNGLDNRRCNLRSATHAENLRNTRKQSGTSSRFKGVCYHRSRWVAYITFDYKQRHLGCFKREEDAAAAYDRAATELHGEFARTNAMLGLLPCD
jgi:hypothetical protein